MDPAWAATLLTTAKDALKTASPQQEEKVLAIYPNTGEVWDAREGHRCWEGAHDLQYLVGDDASSWQEKGAALIGGCCRVTPEQIAAFRTALAE